MKQLMVLVHRQAMDSELFKFTEKQAIPTVGAISWSFFVVDGRRFLAIANENSDSAPNIGGANND